MSNIKAYKPTTNPRRHMTGHTFEEVTPGGPEKSLLVSHRRKAGRDSSGRITVRHQGGGHKRKYRIIDFKRINSISQLKFPELNMIPTDQHG